MLSENGGMSDEVRQKRLDDKKNCKWLFHMPHGTKVPCSVPQHGRSEWGREAQKQDLLIDSDKQCQKTVG